METQETQEAPQPPQAAVKMEIDAAPAASVPEEAKAAATAPPGPATTPATPSEPGAAPPTPGPPLKYPPGYGPPPTPPTGDEDRHWVSGVGWKPGPAPPADASRADNAKRDLKGTRASSRVRRESGRFADLQEAVHKSNPHGASPQSLDHGLHAIDATPARKRGGAGSSPVDGASTAAFSSRKDLVKNYRVHPTHWLIYAQDPSTSTRTIRSGSCGSRTSGSSSC